MLLFINRVICKIFGHRVHMAQSESGFDKVTVHTCLRCKTTLDTSKDTFDIKCNLSGNVVWARIVKENVKTIYIKYNGIRIKRHKQKHNVAMRKSS